MRVADIVAQLPAATRTELPRVHHCPQQGPKVALAVESCRRHVTDEAWQIMAGLQASGYVLYGHGLPNNETDVAKIVSIRPSTVVVQDPREWDIAPSSWREQRAAFSHVDALRSCGALVVVPVKDVHSSVQRYAAFSQRIGAHAWIVHYHPAIVTHLAPYMHCDRIIRTYHSVDSDVVPTFTADREGAVLSGFISGVYPLRRRLAQAVDALPNVTYLPHPGYGLSTCATPRFLQALSRFKVSICTCSIYGYAVRKIIESVACGCIVVTNLPEDEVLPEIDASLVRVSPDISTHEMAELLRRLYADYDPGRQRHFAETATKWYDYRRLCGQLAADIEAFRTQMARCSAYG